MFCWAYSNEQSVENIKYHKSSKSLVSGKIKEREGYFEKFSVDIKLIH